MVLDVGSDFFDPDRPDPGERRVVGQPLQPRSLFDNRPHTLDELLVLGRPIEEEQRADVQPQRRILTRPPDDRFERAQTDVHHVRTFPSRAFCAKAWGGWRHPFRVMRRRGSPLTLTAVAPRRPVQRRPRRSRHTIFETLRESTGEFVQSVANEVVPGVVDALDLDEVVQRLDIQEIVDRVDVSRLIERIDLDVVLAKVDIDALLARVDVNALLAQTELAAVITRSGGALVGQTLDIVRRQGLGLDGLVDRWTNRLLRRRERRPSSPPFGVNSPELRVR